jgi:integrase
MIYAVNYVENYGKYEKAGFMKKVEKNIYQISKFSYQVKMMVGGKKISRVWGTLDEARVFRDSHSVSAALDVHESAIFESRIKKQQSKSYFFKDAIKDYRNISENKKGSLQEGASLDLLSRLPIAEKALFMIGKPDLVKMFKDIRSGEYRKVRETIKKQKMIKPCSEATARRYSNLARHIFEVAKGDGKIDRNPFDLLSKDERPKDGKPRDRRFKGNEYEKLKKVLDKEAGVALVLFVESGMRRGELLRLDWQYIKFNGSLGSARIPETKNNEERTVPLSSVAATALKTLLPKNGVRPISGRVFSLTAPMLTHRWHAARDAIGSPDLRMHDLRHEATSRLFEDKGLNVIEASSITGHKSLQMLKRYANLNADLLAKKLG